MYRLALVMVVVGVAVSTATAQEKKSELGSNIRIPSNIGFIPHIDPDKLTGGVLFDNVYISVPPAPASLAKETPTQTNAKTKAVTLNIPFSTEQRSLPMTIDVRGYVQVQPGAQASLFVSAGGTSKIIGLFEKNRTVTLKGKSKAQFVSKNTGGEIVDFQDRLEVTVQKTAAQPVCQVTLFLLVSQNTDKTGAGGALLGVDSLDFAIVKGGKGKYENK